LPDRMSEVRLGHGSTLQVICHHGDDPWVAGNDGTAERALIPGRNDNEYATPQRMIQGVCDCALSTQYRLLKGTTHVDHTRTRLNTLMKSRCELFGRCTGHLSTLYVHLRKNGTHHKGTARTYSRGYGMALRT